MQPHHPPHCLAGALQQLQPQVNWHCCQVDTRKRRQRRRRRLACSSNSKNNGKVQSVALYNGLILLLVRSPDALPDT